MSHLKQCLQNNKYILGTMLSEIANPNIIRVLKAGGFSYVIIDCEHGYFDYSQVAALTAVANGYDMDIIIRIPEISRGSITKYMDMGADGLLVPMTNTRSDIERVVDYAKYAPLGKRGISTGRPHTEYDPPRLVDYMKQANERTIILAQIETNEGVNNINEILETEGVDAAIIGPNDMSCDCNTPGDFYSAQMQQNISAVINAASRLNKPSGIIAGNRTFLKECRKKGMTVFSTSSEVSIIKNGSKAIVEDMKNE